VDVLKRIDIFERMDRVTNCRIPVNRLTYMSLLQNRVLLVLLSVLFYTGGSASHLWGQLGSSGHSTALPAEYAPGENGFSDSVYVFCGVPGNLEALWPHGNGVTFEWSLYEPSLPGFSQPFRTETGTGSKIGGLEGGGYQVRISGDETDTLFRAWIFVNSPSVTVEVVRHDCQVLDLRGRVDTGEFTYFDPISHGPLTLGGDFNFGWTADPFIGISSSLEPRIGNPPPVETEFTLTAVYHTCHASYSVTEAPQTTRARFEVRPGEGEAPLEVNFNAGSSINALGYQWFFDYRGNAGTGLPNATGMTPSHIYNIPGEYTISLRTINGLCDDLFTLPEKVRVYPSELEVPNVFTPRSGYNDIFRVRAVSMRDFRGTIFGRDGQKIYEWADPAEGWDGTAGNNRPVSPGVYFYDIKGTGWDERRYEFHGPLYLFRNR
jgi:hypothetical protein